MARSGCSRDSLCSRRAVGERRGNPIRSIQYTFPADASYRPVAISADTRFRSVLAQTLSTHAFSELWIGKSFHNQTKGIPDTAVRGYGVVDDHDQVVVPWNAHLKKYRIDLQNVP